MGSLLGELAGQAGCALYGSAREVRERLLALRRRIYRCSWRGHRSLRARLAAVLKQQLALRVGMPH